MTKQCTGSVQACAVRIGRLDDAGNPDIGADNMVVSDALIKIDWKLNVKAGAKFDLTNGCGSTCLTFQDEDEIESVDLSMELCLLDVELIELMTGAGLVNIGGENVGWTLPPVGEKLNRRVSVEAWAKAWDGDQQAVDAGNPLYRHLVWPSVSWVMADSGIANSARSIPFNGRGRSNSNIGDGPGQDLPPGVFVTPMGEYVDDAGLPLSACGYQAVGAS